MDLVDKKKKISSRFDLILPVRFSYDPVQNILRDSIRMIILSHTRFIYLFLSAKFFDL